MNGKKIHIKQQLTSNCNGKSVCARQCVRTHGRQFLIPPPTAAAYFTSFLSIVNSHFLRESISGMQKIIRHTFGLVCGDVIFLQQTVVPSMKFLLLLPPSYVGRASKQKLHIGRHNMLQKNNIPPTTQMCGVTFHFMFFA